MAEAKAKAEVEATAVGRLCPLRRLWRADVGYLSLSLSLNLGEAASAAVIGSIGSIMRISIIRISLSLSLSLSIICIIGIVLRAKVGILIRREKQEGRVLSAPQESSGGRCRDRDGFRVGWFLAIHRQPPLLRQSNPSEPDRRRRFRR